jgi:hypothetical protein
MVLRSGHHLKGVKRFLDSRDPSRRNSTSVIGTSAGVAGDLDARGTLSTTGMYRKSRRSEGQFYGDEYGRTTTTTTKVTKTVTEIEEELNQNNSARNQNNSARNRRGDGYAQILHWLQ